MRPYAICTDTHTYLKFLKEDVEKNNGIVYFYNPDFPDYDSFGDLVEDAIAEEFKKYLDSKQLNLVDWREIIYQMAKDHNNYGNLDNVNPKTQLLKVHVIDTNEDIIITRDEYNTQDKNKYNQVKEISLVNAIRELNSSFYPTGYTGYEQYYVDILGFWRELYNPDYTCSYNITSLNRLEFESV